MGDSKHDVLPKKKMVTLHPYNPITATSLQRPLSSLPKVAVMEKLDCTFLFWYNTEDSTMSVKY